MHTCPKCRTDWGDEILVCPEDGTRLGPPRRLGPISLGEQDTLQMGAVKPAARKSRPGDSGTSLSGATMQATIPSRPTPAPAELSAAKAAIQAPELALDEPPDDVLEDDALEEYDELIGINVGSYRVLRLLGKGGMGSVYLAEHPVIHSRVAIKFLHPQFSANKKIVDRFFNEARAVNLIGHDNILKILDLNATEDGRHYFVMELLEGMPLQQLVDPGLPVSLEVAGPILIQFCEALQAAHDRRIFHRDVKPDNVYLVSHKGRKNFVKVVDFGIAKLTENQAGTGTTQTGMVVGTPAYMSPEQAAGVHQKIDGRSDVYSTGVMMFQLATGKLPFPSSNFGEVLIGHMRLEPPKPRDYNPEMPVEYEQIILQALAKSQDSRQQSMRELEQQIAELMQALRISKELPPADALPASADMVRLQQADGPLGSRKKSERPRFREAEVAKKQTAPLKKSGQTLATRLAPAPTTIRDAPPAPVAKALSPAKIAGVAVGGLVLLGAVIAIVVSLGSSGKKVGRARDVPVSSVSGTPVAVEPIAPTLLSVISDPLGATVEATWKEGTRKGLTPLDLRVPRDTKVTLIFTLPGYAPYRQDVIADESQVVTAQMQRDLSAQPAVAQPKRVKPARVKTNEDVIDVEGQLK